MTRDEYVQILFAEVQVLARALPHLYALVGCIDNTRPTTVTKAKEHAEGLIGLGYAWRPKKRDLVDEVIPRAEGERDLRDIALDAIGGVPLARADILDAWAVFREACEEMGLPATGANAAHAYLVRQLHRLAADERAIGVCGPACHLVDHPAELAERAYNLGIDRDPGGPDRWRKRLNSQAP